MKSPLAQLNEDVVFGRSNGKIIWQPRIGCWYTDKKFAGELLPPPYTEMELPDIFRSLECSDRLYGWYNRCFRLVGRIEEHPFKFQLDWLIKYNL